MTTSRRLRLTSLAACTDYDFEIVPWIDDYMAEDDLETAEVHKNICLKTLKSKASVLGSSVVPKRTILNAKWRSPV